MYFIQTFGFVTEVLRPMTLHVILYTQRVSLSTCLFLVGGEGWEGAEIMTTPSDKVSYLIYEGHFTLDVNSA